MSSESYTIDCGAGIPQADSVRVVPLRATAEEPGREQFKFSHPTDSIYSGSRAHFEASETDRLNEAHWLRADDTPINDVLSWQLPTIRTRSTYESINNPSIEGLILSHTLAVFGEHGPLIDFESENQSGDEWCRQVEQIWEAWCDVADASGSLTFNAMAKQWNVNGWRCGESLEQFVTEDRSFRIPGIPSLRLLGIETPRLVSPFDSTADPNVVMGIRRNRLRRPTSYWISDDYHSIGKGKWYPARDILHLMDRVQAERGQARGIPWANTGLPVAADLRDYDTQVLDASRNAADMALFAYTDHPDAEFTDAVPEYVEYRRRRLNYTAPGWKPAMLASTQPTAQYKEHRGERMGDFGRGKGVPGMITRLDAREHNYSSARFDYQLLGESAKHLRSTLYNPALYRLASLVIQESQLMGILGPMPRGCKAIWIWPSLPEIDESKSAAAEKTYLHENGTISYSDACAQRHGRRGRDVAKKRARDNRMLRENGLPELGSGVSSTNSATAVDTPDNDSRN